jgi:hypothetical protein
LKLQIESPSVTKPAGTRRSFSYRRRWLDIMRWFMTGVRASARLTTSPAWGAGRLRAKASKLASSVSGAVKRSPNVTIHRSPSIGTTKAARLPAAGDSIVMANVASMSPGERRKIRVL